MAIDDNLDCEINETDYKNPIIVENYLNYRYSILLKIKLKLKITSKNHDYHY